MYILNKDIASGKDFPVKVIQFGEGNFLRAFADYMIDVCNEKDLFDGNVVIVKPRNHGDLSAFKEQDYKYTVSLRGIIDKEPKVVNRVVTSVSDVISAYDDYDAYMEYAKLDTLRFVISNTTEAGIVYDESDRLDMNPPESFPGKLTKFLYERFKAFSGDISKGLIILPVELIDDNGKVLKSCVDKFISLWKLEPEFSNWVDSACVFCSTLVDRIVSGYPKDEAESIFEELGYEDKLLVAGEPFALWVIESPKDISKEFPLRDAGLNVVFTDNIKPYKQRKVRILNGAHTSFVLASYLAGNNIVLESMNDPDIYKFMHDTVFNEVIPTLSLNKEDLVSFANEVIDRFKNPYVKHALLSISLNSVSKWKARCMPSFLDYYNKFGEVPKHLCFSLAALMQFYSSNKLDGNALCGLRNGEVYKIMDDLDVLKFFAEYSDKPVDVFAKAFLSKDAFWGTDLSPVGDTYKLVCEYLTTIRESSVREAIRKFFD